MTSKSDSACKIVPENMFRNGRKNLDWQWGAFKSAKIGIACYRHRTSLILQTRWEPKWAFRVKRRGCERAKTRVETCSLRSPSALRALDWAGRLMCPKWTFRGRDGVEFGAEMDISGDRDAEASERSERSFSISLFSFDNKKGERRSMTAVSYTHLTLPTTPYV